MGAIRLIHHNERKDRNMDTNEELRLARLDGEVRVALTAMGAKNARLAAKAIDYGKLELGEDGAVVGLEEQLAALSKSDPYLFREPEVRRAVTGTTHGKLVQDPDDMTDADYYRWRMKKRGADE